MRLKNRLEQLDQRTEPRRNVISPVWHGHEDDPEAYRNLTEEEWVDKFCIGE